MSKDLKEVKSDNEKIQVAVAKNKKPFYKKVSFWAILIVVLFILSALNQPSENSNDSTANETEKSQESEPDNIAETTEEEAVSQPVETAKVPIEHKSALSQAKSYANTMHMSKQGVYDQLISEYGGQFTAEAAQYAIDNVESDWNKNALNKAKSYQDTMSMSPAAIRNQLVSEYGEKFTQEEADYAIANLEQ